MKTFWIKKIGLSAVDIFSAWGIKIKSIPPKPFPTLKSIAKREWQDSQGDDEYIPPTPIYEAEEVTIKFFYEGGLDSIADNVIGFLEYLQGGELSFYDEYTGRKGVFRYKSYLDNAKYHQDGDELEFSVVFKINDPTENGEL